MFMVRVSDAFICLTKDELSIGHNLEQLYYANKHYQNMIKAVISLFLFKKYIKICTIIFLPKL